MSLGYARYIDVPGEGGGGAVLAGVSVPIPILDRGQGTIDCGVAEAAEERRRKDDVELTVKREVEGAAGVVAAWHHVRDQAADIERLRATAELAYARAARASSSSSTHTRLTSTPTSARSISRRRRSAPSSISIARSVRPVLASATISSAAGGASSFRSLDDLPGVFGRHGGGNGRGERRRIEMQKGIVLSLAAMISVASAACAAGEISESQGAEGPVQSTQSALTQTSAPWHLDRIDQRNLPLNTLFNYTCGGEIDVYVVSTGIQTTASLGTIANDFQAPGSSAGTDCSGIGTSMAGIISDSQFGAAKDSRLHSINVYPCSGAPSDVVLQNAVQWLKLNAAKPSVVVFDRPMNAYSAAAKTDIRSLGPAGFTVVLPIAAGAPNANEASLIQVASTNNADARLFPSSGVFFGDLVAPGANVQTNNTSGGSWFKSGNEYATAEVAAVAAQYLQLNPTATPAAVKAALMSDGTTIPGGTSKLLHAACL